MPVSNNSLNLLAQYIGGIQQPSQVNTARQILLRSQIDWTAANIKPQGGGGKSVVSRIFDILSRPNYAVASVGVPVLEDLAQHHFKQAFKDIDILDPSNTEPSKRFMRGLTGKDKSTFTEAFLKDPILQQTGLGNLPKPVRAGAGLVFDVALDPTTYVGPGIIKKLGLFGKLGKKAPATAEAIEGVPKAEDLSKTNEILKAATEATGKAPQGKTATLGIPAKLTNVKWSAAVTSALSKLGPGAGKNLHDVKLVGKSGKALKPGQKYGSEFTSHMQRAQHFAKLGRSPSFYGQVQRAEQLLNRIREGDPQAIARMAPKPSVEVLKATIGEKSIAINTARNVSKKLKVPADKFINPKQQLIIFSHLLKQSKGGPIERMARTTAMMREAEKYLHSQGYGFKYWDGTAVRLTEIFDEMGSIKKIGPEILSQLEKNAIDFPPLDQAVEAIRARSAMHDSKFVELGLSQVTDAAAKAEALTTPARAEVMVKGLASDLKSGMQGARVSPAGQKAASVLFNTISKSRVSSVQKAMSATYQVAHQVMNAKVTKQAKLTREEKINKAIEQHMNSKYRSVATSLGNNNKAVEFLGERFTTHYGQSAMRPIAQDALLSAQANAAARSKVWGNGVLKSTTVEARREALRAAQRGPGAATMQSGDPQLATLFRDSIERLFSSTGIKDTAMSVSTRAAFTMKDINSELRRIGSKFQFTNEKKIEDALGEIHDYSKNVDWLKSWETFKLPDNVDPVEFINHLETATEKVSKRYALLDEVAARFSTVRPLGVYRHLAEDPRLAGRYFTKEAVVQVNKMNEMLKNAYHPSNDFVKMVDKVTSAWKSGVTIYAPSHHIRNLIGDTWMSWIAGVNSPQPYYAAAKVLKANKGRYAGSIPDVEKLVAPQALEQALGRGVTNIPVEAVVTKTKNGIKLTAEQIYIAAHQRGLLLSARAIEDIYAEPLMPKVFGGKVQGFARGAAETREHYVRLAHFIDAISKDKGNSLKSIFDNAAHTVRKWHPDGMDLTNFERRYLRRIFPFYSWTRKAFPLVLEAMVMKPGKVLLPAKINEAIQGAVGIDASRTDPFPSDQMFPDWIKEKGIGPISATGGPLGMIAGLSRQGDSGGYTIVNPSNPMEDLISQFAGSGNPRAPLQALGSSLNPLARIPIETTTDKQMFTDVPVSYDPNRYLTEQIPGGAILSRLTNMGVLGPTQRGQKEGLGNTEAMLNYLTAAGVQGTGPYIKQAEYEARGRQRKDSKKALQDFMRQYGG